MNRLVDDPYAYIRHQVRARNLSSDVFATFLCVMLEEAETIFGSKLDPYPFMFAGINFDSDTPHMQIWGTGRHGRHKYLMIRLSRHCLNDRPQALWQLSHECVHLLSPRDKAETNVLEEGIASWYQRRWVKRVPSIFPDWVKGANHGLAPKFAKYNQAADLVDRLLSVDESVIKRIRQAEPKIYKIRRRLILENAPWITPEEASQLSESFSL